MLKESDEQKVSKTINICTRLERRRANLTRLLIKNHDFAIIFLFTLFNSASALTFTSFIFNASCLQVENFMYLFYPYYKSLC